MRKSIPKKRGNTLVRTIEKKYGVNLGYRDDAQLHTMLKKEGLPSLSKLLKILLDVIKDAPQAVLKP